MPGSLRGCCLCCASRRRVSARHPSARPASRMLSLLCKSASGFGPTPECPARFADVVLTARVGVGFRPDTRAPGPLRGCCLYCASPRRVSARHPSNFHLRAQMKVTKAKGLNTICAVRLPKGHEPELDRFKSRIRPSQDLPKRKCRDGETPRQVALGEPSRGSLQQPRLLAGRTAQIVLRPSSLVTFFWALRRKLLGCRAETRRRLRHENERAMNVQRTCNQRAT